MAVQPSPYLVMTDGTDTVTFQDGANPGGQTNWPVVRAKWGPRIAGIRTSQLAGHGPYAEAQEDLSCNILGTTAALAWQNLDTLTRLLDKAERWWLRNESISPVLLKYVPQGSTIHSNGTPLQAIVLGRVGDDELNGVDLPDNVNDAGFIFQIFDVRVLCMRRGAWTGLTETPATSSSLANPAVLTRAFASTHPINSPVDVTIGGFDKTATPTIKAGFLMVGSNINDIQFAQPTLVTGYTSVADSANLAKFGFIVRYTPTVTTAVLSGNTFISGSAMSGTVGLYATVRNNSATTTFQIAGIMTGPFGSAQTAYQTIDTSTTNPRVIFLGEVSGIGFTGMQVSCIASAASGTLDINYVLCVNLRDETVAVIAHESVDVSAISLNAVTLSFKFNPITDQGPTAYVSGTIANAAVTYHGPLPLIATGINIYAIWVATNNNYWVFTNVSNTAVALTLSVTRYRSYLSPQ